MSLISIIVPVVSRVNRQVLHTRQLESLAQKVTNHDFEFIFVDDGSNEESISILEKCVAQDKRYRIVNLTRNFGPTALFLAGIAYASGDCAGFYLDPNIDPSMIFQKLIHHWETGSHIVLGKWKDSRKKPFSSRRFLQRERAYIRNLVSNRLFFQDICSLLIDKQVMYVLPQVSEGYSHIVDLLAWTGYQTHLVEISIEAQEGNGKRLISQDKMISLEYSEGVFSLQRFKISLTFGIIFTILGVLSSIAIIVVQGYSPNIISDWWILLTTFVFILGIQLWLMGIYSYHLFRTLVEIYRSRAFVVNSVVNPPVSNTSGGREKIEKMILSLESIRKQRLTYADSLSDSNKEEDIQD